MNAMKRKVLINAEIERKKKKEAKRKKFSRIYDRCKSVTFKPKERLNMEKHFFMPVLTDEFNFGGSRNAQIVYPVLCSQANFREMEYFQMSRENIAKLAGISTVAVDKGIKFLENFKINDPKNEIQTPFLQRKKIQDGRRRYWTYLPGFFRPDVKGLEIKAWKGQYLVFYTCLIESGIWAKLSRNAKALYLSMRSRSHFDQDLYYELENIDIPTFDVLYDELDVTNEQEKKELYKSRKWEICDRPLTELFKLADIPYSNITKLIDELERFGLAERLHESKSVFQVWLKPQKFKKIQS